MSYVVCDDYKSAFNAEVEPSPRQQIPVSQQAERQQGTIPAPNLMDAKDDGQDTGCNKECYHACAVPLPGGRAPHLHGQHEADKRGNQQCIAHQIKSVEFLAPASAFEARLHGA